MTARAYPEADRFYTLAVDQAQWLPESGPDLMEEAARAASWAGHPQRAASCVVHALAGSAAAGAGRPRAAAGAARALPLGSGGLQGRGRSH